VQAEARFSACGGVCVVLATVIEAPRSRRGQRRAIASSHRGPVEPVWRRRL